MASTALTAFNAAVDASALNAARKAEVKNLGERLYIAGAKETIQHLRKHAVTVRDDIAETTERRQRAADLVNLIDALITNSSDAWWLDING